MAKALRKQQERLAKRRAIERDRDSKRGTQTLTTGAFHMPGSMNAKKGGGEKRKRR